MVAERAKNAKIDFGTLGARGGSPMARIEKVSASGPADFNSALIGTDLVTIALFLRPLERAP